MLIAFIRGSKPRNYSSSLSPFQTLSSHKPITNPLYNFLPESQNPNNVVAVVCSSLKRKDHVILDCLQEQGLFRGFTNLEFSRILLRCQSDSASALTFFHWVRNRLQLLPSARNYCIMIHMLVWSKNFKQAMKILLELVQLNANASVNVYDSLLSCVNDCNWDPVVFDMLIKAYLRKDMVVEGFQTFMSMAKLGFVPSIVAINCLLNGLSKMDYAPKCWEVYQEMLRIELRPNRCTFNILTHIFCKEGDMDKVNDFLEGMEEEGFYLDTVTYNILIDGYCRRMRLKDAVYLYNIMCKRGVVPDLITYTTLMSGFCKGGNVREAHRLFNSMIHSGVEPDVVSYNTLIYGYCRRMRLKDAVYLYNIMCKRGVVPDLVTYTTLMSGFCKGGNVREAHRLFNSMIHSGVEPDVVSYNTLIYGYCKEGMMHEARFVLFDMIRNKVCPDNFTCWLLIKGYQNVCRMISALNLVVELARFGIMVSPDIYCYLIFALCKDDRPFAAKSLLAQMSHGYVASAEVYNELIDSLSRGKFIEEALELKLEMVSKELKPNLSAHRAIIRGLCELSRSMEALASLQDMIESGLPVDIKIFRYLVNGLCKEKNFSEAESLMSFYAKEFHIFDAECYNALVRVLSEGGEPSELMKFQDRMARLGYTPNSLTCKYVIDGMWKAMKAQSRKLLVE